ASASTVPATPARVIESGATDPPLRSRVPRCGVPAAALRVPAGTAGALLMCNGRSRGRGTGERWGMMQERKHGLDESASPLAEERARGGPEEQQQRWPGRESELRPPADHGEES